MVLEAVQQARFSRQGQSAIPGVQNGSVWRSEQKVLVALFLVGHHKSTGAPTDSLLCKVTAANNLQVRDVTSTIKKAASLASEDPSRYGSHSLRNGGATALFNAGTDSLAVKQFGRWKSDVVKRYTAIDGRLATRMAHTMMRGHA
uniref:Tyr recombinase domain-containing protein n=1 Tax=Globisporangium ultimum (strain ATCC 200006 / CBS 805.95 / DAOM BR144) TaxID=431595 RepID=K3WFR3_GLOUD